MNRKPSPATVARWSNMRRLRAEDKRVSTARRNGYRGPLTRNEVAARTARQQHVA